MSILTTLSLSLSLSIYIYIYEEEVQMTLYEEKKIPDNQIPLKV